MPSREPLGLIDTNRHLPSASSPLPVASSSSSSSRKPLKLAPIFTRTSSTSSTRIQRHAPSSSLYTQENSSPTPHARKRVKLDLSVDNDEEECNNVEPLRYGQRSSMTGFFSTTGSSSASSESRARAGKNVEVAVVVPTLEAKRPGWNRRRIRLGAQSTRGFNLASTGLKSMCGLYDAEHWLMKRLQLTPIHSLHPSDINSILRPTRTPFHNLPTISSFPTGPLKGLLSTPIGRFQFDSQTL